MERRKGCLQMRRAPLLPREPGTGCSRPEKGWRGFHHVAGANMVRGGPSWVSGCGPLVWCSLRQVPIFVMLQLDWLSDDGQSLRYKERAGPKSAFDRTLNCSQFGTPDPRNRRHVPKPPKHAPRSRPPPGHINSTKAPKTAQTPAKFLKDIPRAYPPQSQNASPTNIHKETPTDIQKTSPQRQPPGQPGKGSRLLPHSLKTQIAGVFGRSSYEAS